MPEITVGMIGLGIMGSAMSANLLKAGLQVVGFDIMPEKIEALSALGGRGAASVADVAGQCEVIMTSLPSIAAFEEATRGPDGILAAGGGRTVIETSTLPVADKQRAHDVLREAGTVLLDCPLSGTGAQAASGDLVVFGSGDKAAYEACIPIFKAFSRSQYYLGKFGNGSAMKFVANLLVAVHNVAAAEALVLGQKAGLDAETMLEVLTDSAGNSRMLEIRGPLMTKGDYDDATMKVDIWQKDMAVITDFARALGCPAPLFSATVPIYSAALGQGRGKQDTAAVCAVLEELAGLSRPE
jgi:3-hydroxyisobutyrate dehydrogenase-like beta-hydroxyacid dehydrogenase